jgi:hypothetical protein
MTGSFSPVGSTINSAPAASPVRSESKSAADTTTELWKPFCWGSGLGELLLLVEDVLSV